MRSNCGSVGLAGMNAFNHHHRTAIHRQRKQTERRIYQQQKQQRIRDCNREGAKRGEDTYRSQQSLYVRIVLIQGKRMIWSPVQQGTVVCFVLCVE
jgi:hypothetical protein